MDRSKAYPVDEALKLVKETAVAKFDESVDVAVNLGVDAKKSDQTVRGSVVLPAGTGKKVRVAVFAQGDKAKEAQDAGADIVGFDDLAAKVKEGFMEFDVVIATPDAMRVVGQLGQILGPRGLMPNPKVGTVTPDVATAVKNAQAGQVQYRTDKGGIVQCTIGRASFAPEQLKTNLLALIEALNKAKPQGTKGIYLKKISVSCDDGRGCARRHGEPRAAGAGVTARRTGTDSTNLRERARRTTSRAASRQRPRGRKLKTGEGVGGRDARYPDLRPDSRPSADGAPRTGFSWRKVTEQSNARSRRRCGDAPRNEWR